MKKLLAAALFISILSCNDNSNETSTTTDTTTTDIGGVENVNGNIPDTMSTGATPYAGDNRPQVDSSYADTTNKTGR